MKAQLLLSIVTALSASLCCITPILAITGGTSGIASTFSWIEPFRIYFILATFLVLGFAWFRAFTSKEEDDCGCEQKVSFLKSKKFLGIVTVLSLLLISFPSYSTLFFSHNSATMVQDQDDKKKIELAVKGMTCTSCELHIESEVKKLSGVYRIKASYEKGST